MGLGQVADLPSRWDLGTWSACVFGLEFGLGIREEAFLGPFPECCNLSAILWPFTWGPSPGGEMSPEMATDAQIATARQGPLAPTRHLSPVADSG